MHINSIKNEKNEVVKAGCVVLNEKRQVLLVSNLEGLNWAFPKGHAENNETMEQIALREVKEETGLDVQLIKRLSDITYVNRETGEPIRIAMFLAKPLESEIVSEQGTQVKFFEVDEAKKILPTNLVFILDEV
jgi:ADP-ribose pyrophosphatase YjhB (NUDIX family)